MIGQYVISFREGLEAALIIAVTVAYLKRSGRRHMVKYVWYGAILSAAASTVLAVLTGLIYGALSKPEKTLFEASASILAVLILSLMVYWMAVKSRHIQAEIEARVEKRVARGNVAGLAASIFFLVFREGFETVLFLTPFAAKDPVLTVAGALAGLLTSAAFSYLVFLAGVKVSIRRFFYFTSILLVLIAGGLTGYGTHELLEYLEMNGFDTGWLGSKAYDLGIPESNLLHHKNVVGSAFAVLFGYASSAEWGRLIAQVVYLSVMLPLVVKVYIQYRNG